jgi:hypothetical protein
MDADSLNHLLAGGHLSVPERIGRGIWPHDPLHFKDLVGHLAKVVTDREWFPYESVPHVPGNVVNELGTIQRVSDGYLYHASRASPMHPTLLVQSTAQHFATAEDVARHYLKWSLHLPGDLDSWKVI